MTKPTSPNYINHIAVVMDASSSMRRHDRDVVRAVDAEIAHLAERSRALDQETRITVYTFADEPRCVIYDKDVLRLPSVAPFYEASGNTALIAATLKSQSDLAATAQLYGDHAFLTYVFTDGEENVSRFSRVCGGGGYAASYRNPPPHTTQELTTQLRDALAAQADNWTVACFVPNSAGVFEAKKFGFPSDNIAVWDATTRDGIAEGFSDMRTATETFMTGRTRGVRGSKTLFAGGADRVNSVNVRASTGFRPLDKDAYWLLPVTMAGDEIRPFVQSLTGQPYRAGSAYYELTKPEKIQPQKDIMVRNRRSGRVYTGPDARSLLNLPDHEVRVKPEHNAEFQIFVQSTSVNRKLVAGTKVLVVKP